MIEVSSDKPPERLSRFELTFGYRDGHTYLADSFAEAPLKVLRPFDIGDGRVLLQLLNVGPGLLAGDRYKLRVKLKPGARVVLVNQSATKLHRMPPGQGAQQQLHLVIEEGAELEYYPGLTIPFAGSDAHFGTEVRLSDNARFALLELWAMGRVQRGELFAFRHLSNRLRIYQREQLIYADGLELTPVSARLTGISDNFSYLASGFWQWDVPWPDLECSSAHAVTGGCGPERGYLRALARDGFELTQGVRAQLHTWQQVRGAKPWSFERFLL